MSTGDYERRTHWTGGVNYIIDSSSRMLRIMLARPRDYVQPRKLSKLGGGNFRTLKFQDNRSSICSPHLRSVLHRRKLHEQIPLYNTGGG